LLLKLEKNIDKFIDFLGLTISILLIIMILNVAYDVAMRYIFHNSSIAMQELEWHFFAIIILYGTGYALKYNAHVRVDFLYDNFCLKKQAWVNILGVILFLLPLTLLVIYSSWDFVMNSYTTNEISENPGGLSYLWIIKAQIPIAFIFLLLCAFNFMLHNINVLKDIEKPLPKERDEL